MMQTYETKIIFDECVVCHRHTSLGHMGILFHEKERNKISLKALQSSTGK